MLNFSINPRAVGESTKSLAVFRSGTRESAGTSVPTWPTECLKAAVEIHYSLKRTSFKRLLLSLCIDVICVSLYARVFVYIWRLEDNFRCHQTGCHLHSSLRQGPSLGPDLTH